MKVIKTGIDLRVNPESPNGREAPIKSLENKENGPLLLNSE